MKLDVDADGGLVTTDSGIRYVNGHCPCEDFQRYGDDHWCKHRLSVELVKRAKAALVPMAEDFPARPALALPEAPASVNVRVMMHGHECQVTLRDTDEQRLLVRLKALLDQYPVADQTPIAATPPLAAPAVCPLHGVPMRPHTKQGETWFSHKQNGGWCRGRDQV